MDIPRWLEARKNVKQCQQVLSGRRQNEMDTSLTMVMTIALTVAFGCQTRAQGGSISKDEAVQTAAATCDVGAPAGPAGQSARDARHARGDSNGPTVLLNYRKETFEKNPIRSFMYFIPLISPVPVGQEIGAENRQQVGVISYERKITSKSFSVTCEFEMSGNGFCKYTFEPTGMIALRIEESKKHKGEPLTNLLDYINFEGEGLGRIQIKGTVDGSVQTVTEVGLEFNGKGRKSPVTIGLYELKSKDGRYRGENRSNEVVARVNTLVFKKSENPRMGITVASISKKAGSNGPIGHLKAAIANLFIKPVKVDPLGNETLLRFGWALFEQEPTFTFPKAGNLKELPILAANPKRE